MSNKLILAAAGSGKTQYIIEKTKEIPDERVIILTYTNANEAEIQKRIARHHNGLTPSNITIQTWYRFLLQHGIRPYSNCLFKNRIAGLFERERGFRNYSSKANYEKYFLNKDCCVDREKLSELTVLIDQELKGAVSNRISKIYKHIFIDEVQDLAGYDFELVLALLQTQSNICMTGDLRQRTYQTNHQNKNKGRNILSFLRSHQSHIEIDIDETSLQKSHRCHRDICEIANNIYRDLPPAIGIEHQPTGHDGVYFVRKKDVSGYLDKYHPIQLRWDKRTSVSSLLPVYNYGESKGLTFDRTIIYPTKPLRDWLKASMSNELKKESAPRVYVAVTRAKYSVGIIWDEGDPPEIPGIHVYSHDNCNK